MGKQILFEQLQRGRNRHVAYALDELAKSVRLDSTTDGMLTILCTPAGFEFYRAGVFLDRPKDALAALAVLLSRVRQQVDDESAAP